MTTPQDLRSMNRLWKAIDSRYMNRCKYFTAQVATDQLQRIDDQLQLALYALLQACPGATLADIGIAEPLLTKGMRLFTHTCVKAQRENGACFPAFAASLAALPTLERPDLFQAVVEAFLFIPETHRAEPLQQLRSALNQERAQLLDQWLGCYLPTEQRRQFLAEEHDLLTAIQQGRPREQLQAQFRPLLSIMPNSEELLWAAQGSLTVTELESILETDMTVGFNLLSISDDDDSLPLITNGLEQPRTNALAYQAWLYRTGQALPQTPMLQDSADSAKSAGPLLADANAAVQWLQHQTDEQHQVRKQHHAQRLQRRVSLLDDCVWLAQGGLTKTDHLIRLHPYSLRQVWCSAPSAIIDEQKDTSNGH